MPLGRPRKYTDEERLQRKEDHKKAVNKKNRDRRLHELIAKNPNISKSTVISYANRIKRVWKLMYPGTEFKSKAFLTTNVRKVVKVINESTMPVSSKQSSYSAILSIYYDKTGKETMGKMAYKKQFDYWSDEKRDEYKDQVKTVQESKLWISKNDLVESLEDFKKRANRTKKEKDFLDFFTLSLFVTLPPRRSEDYAIMKINGNTTDKKYNYITSDDDGKFKSFIFNKYKASTSKGQQVFDREYMESLPKGDEILDLLDWWLLEHSDEEFMLLDELNTNSMTKRIKRISQRIVGKESNINIYRHMYISYYLQTPEGQWINDKEKVANFMSHSLRMQEQYRKREEKKKVTNDIDEQLTSLKEQIRLLEEKRAQIKKYKPKKD